jgi:hypothetical protein
MSDAARKDRGQSPEALAKRDEFERLYRDWHAARAAFYDPDATHDNKTVRVVSEVWRDNLDESFAANRMAILAVAAD